VSESNVGGNESGQRSRRTRLRYRCSSSSSAGSVLVRDEGTSNWDWAAFKYLFATDRRRY
jgi:hypothetical protein